MKTILITGAKGFIGRNLAAHLRRRADVRLLRYDLDNTRGGTGPLGGRGRRRLPPGRREPAAKPGGVRVGQRRLDRDALPHPRPARPETPVIFSSSIQAECDNPYGRQQAARRRPSSAIRRRSGAPVAIFRLKNVFGKWCRPNYNSVVATFCHNFARDLPIQISDPEPAIGVGPRRRRGRRVPGGDGPAAAASRDAGLGLAAIRSRPTP